MAKCVLEIRDEVNVKFVGLDVKTRRAISDEAKYFLPYAYHMPAYKLGRWDGCVRYCDIGGRTYMNILDKLLPIVQKAGYEIEIDDKRQSYNFNFPTITDTRYDNTMRPKGHPEEGEPVEFLIPKGTYIYFNEGDKVNKGDMIVDGTPAPTDILNILGIEALAEYMVREVQKVYRLQGVLIDDKHIECITRQMLQKVEVIDAGDSEYLVGDIKDKTEVIEKNILLKKEGIRL